MWRSLVAHLHGVQGVEGSNPFTPTNKIKDLAQKWAKSLLFYRYFVSGDDSVANSGLTSYPATFSPIQAIAVDDLRLLCQLRLKGERHDLPVTDLQT